MVTDADLDALKAAAGEGGWDGGTPSGSRRNCTNGATVGWAARR